MKICVMLQPIAALQQDLVPGQVVPFVDDWIADMYVESGHARIATEEEIAAASAPAPSADAEGLPEAMANSGGSESSGGEASTGKAEEGEE